MTDTALHPNRLDRIESKLDRLTEVVEMLARVDERQQHYTERLSDLRAAQSKDRKALEAALARITELERVSSTRGSGLARVERGAWVFFTAGIGALFYYLRGSG